MKNFFKNKKNIIILGIVLFILLIILLIVLFNMLDKTPQEKDYNESWMRSEIRSSYLVNTDFSSNKCGTNYYSSSFIVTNEKLYDDNNNEITDGVYSIFMQPYGECQEQLLFFTDTKGNFYYVNNKKSSTFEKYQIIKFEELQYIVGVVKNYMDDSISAIDNNNEETELSAYIQDYVINPDKEK